MKVLVTAFTPFNNKMTNTTMEVIKLLENVDKVILPVSYASSIKELLNAFELYKPDYILSLGEANRSGLIEIERYAHNLMGSSIADNDGVVINNTPIKDGSICLTPNYDVYDVTQKLKQDGFKVIESHTAGTFICNLVMYKVLELKEEKKIKDGAFIHIPHIEGNNNDVQIIGKCITKFIDYFTKN